MPNTYAANWCFQSKCSNISAEGLHFSAFHYICHASAHAQDNNNNNYLYVQWVAMVFLVYLPRRFGMQLPLVAMVLREASALMRILVIL